MLKRVGVLAVVVFAVAVVAVPAWAVHRSGRR